MSLLRLRGLRAGNLQDLDLELAHGRWTALHGPSGAGKSALLFGVLEPVSARRFRILRDPRALPGGDEAWLRRVADGVEGLQPVVAMAGEIPRGRGEVEVGTALDLWRPLAESWRRIGRRRCGHCGRDWRPPDLDSLVALAHDFAKEQTLYVFSAAGGQDSQELLQAGWTRVRLGTEGLCRLEEAPATLPEDAWLLLDRFRWKPDRLSRWREAIQTALHRGVAFAVERDRQNRFFPPAEQCPQCGHPVPRREAAELLTAREAEDVLLQDSDWGQWCQAPLSDWLQLPEPCLGPARRRLEFLQRTGLGHLSPVRPLGTLSLGESRRLEMVGLLSQVRRDQLVLFDEPGMGLHGNERRELARLFRELVQQGNTLLTADPARDFLESADAWLLLGPGGGPHGGRLVDRGDANRLPDLERWRPPAARPPEPDQVLSFAAIRHRYLDIDKLELPLQRVVGLAGVSGSGKSTLLEEVLVPRLRAGEDFQGKIPTGGVAVLLERALGSAAFSTIATLSGAWTAIRQAFAEGEEARIRGLSASDLVAREGQGACGRCRGHGLDPDRLPCPSCQGLGLREDLLQLRLRQRSLREWLTTPLESLQKRLPAGGSLRQLAGILVQLGMGQRCFGERGRLLSLGERSRIALARALAAARPGWPKLFLLDEPCLGLPTWEARKVVELLRKLCRQGHSFWVVDHHEVLLRSVDWMLELGPGAGPGGGRLLYSGEPKGLAQAGTPTGRWLLARRRKPKPPKAAKERPPIRSMALAESWARSGRQALEADLWRELATRSVLVADALGQAPLGKEALPPTAWPWQPPEDASLAAVLGIQGRLEEAVRQKGAPACAACGQRGPWPDLLAALEAEGPRLPSRDGSSGGEDDSPGWLFRCPLHLAEEAWESASGMLQAAGFRRLIRNGERILLRRGVQPQPGDALFLDRFVPDPQEDPGRIRDLEHHALLLGQGWLEAEGEDGHVWRYRSGRCPDCGRGDPAAPQPLEHRLAGRSLKQLLQEPLRQALAHGDQHAGDAGPFAELAELLAGTSLLDRPAQTRLRALQGLERRLARLVGWLTFPLEGVVLLHDQPLSGLPSKVAERLAKALMQPLAGAHRFTDPEGYARTEASSALPEVPASWLAKGQAFSLALDFAEVSDPPPAPAEATVAEALGLEAKLREHFLRSEEARLRGWKPSDLRRHRQRRGGSGRICSECGGQGGWHPHPAVRLLCNRCQGSGWGRETAALEDRGLRWPDLAQQDLAGLAKHFAESPRLAGPLKAAVALGMGELRLGQRLHELPLAAPSLLAVAAVAEDESSLQEVALTVPAAGLNTLEACEMAITMEGFLSTVPFPNWRDHHPVWTVLKSMRRSKPSRRERE
ncbi:MAG: hypothetical protein DWQ01_12025 [Planctomycetota bacterium]|nr:MAG: hypothetical protein DWQ01_12025 [Planctomycetota bacterium]